MKRSQKMPVWLWKKMVLAQHNCTVSWGKGTPMLCTCRKEYNKMIQLLLSISNWPIIMIGPDMVRY
jgi:hypothetical protein